MDLARVDIKTVVKLVKDKELGILSSRIRVLGRWLSREWEVHSGGCTTVCTRRHECYDLVLVSWAEKRRHTVTGTWGLQQTLRRTERRWICKYSKRLRYRTSFRSTVNTIDVHIHDR